VQLIVCTFDAAEQAESVRDVLEQLDRRDHAIRLGNLALVRRAADGDITFEESGDSRGRIGQVLGAVVGSVTDFISAFAGSFGPPAGQIAARETQSAVDRLVRDAGFPDDALLSIGARLHSGETALITLVRPEDAAFVSGELERLGGTLIAHALPSDVVAELTRSGE
jgi:uncharacterized membrane protein